MSIVFLQKRSPNLKYYKISPTICPVFRNLDLFPYSCGVTMKCGLKHLKPMWAEMDNVFPLNKLIKY